MWDPFIKKKNFKNLKQQKQSFKPTQDPSRQEGLCDFAGHLSLMPALSRVIIEIMK